MSQTYIGIYVMMASAILPHLGVTIGTDQLTTTVSVLCTIAGAVWAAIGRHRLGGVSILGIRV